jgi:glycosyltransferase involved in cell wall biosynthesis
VARFEQATEARLTTMGHLSQNETTACPPTVSILILTCNHERYLAGALDSALMQVAPFRYEIVVGVDHSTDHTAQIAQEYQRRYPDIVRLLLAETNIGMHENFKNALDSCRGKYIALLDGDDYWTDAAKLHKQITVLESSAGIAICFHKVQVIRDGRAEAGEYMPCSQKPLASVEDLLRANFIPTCSSVVRRACYRGYPAWMRGLGMGDWPLHILIAEQGKIAYIDEVMASYRMHRDGAWSSKSASYQAQEELKLFERLAKHFNGRLSRAIEERLFTARVDCAVACAAEGDLQRARAYTRACIGSRPFHRHLYRRCAIAARVYAPRTTFQFVKAVQSKLREVATR